MAALVVVLLGLAVPIGLRSLGGGPGAVNGRAASAGAPGHAAAGSSGGGAEVAGAPSAGSAGSAGATTPDASSATPSGTTDTGPVIGPKISRTAWLGLKVTDLGAASARARVVATDAGGQVTSEDVVTSVDPTGGVTGGPGNPVGSSSIGTTPAQGDSVSGPSAPSLPDVGVDQARMVLNVPSKALDQVLTQLSTLGSVSYRSSQSQDVTDTYVDTRARIQPMRDGIERVRALLARTTDLGQVITLEAELSRRQADLDSLTQRLAQLDAMTTTSDVTVSMWTDTTPTTAPSGQGISGGLRSAWDSLLGSLTVVLTGLAAMLPWLVVLVPLGLLGLRLWRRHGSRATAPTGSAKAGD